MEQLANNNVPVLYRLPLMVTLLLAVLAGLFHYLPTLANPGHSVRSAQFRILWSQKSNKQIFTAPVLVNGVLVYGTYDGSLEGVSSEDGHELWMLKFPDPVFSVMADGQGVIYAGTGLHDTKVALLTAVKAATGRIVWQREFNGHLEEPPQIDEAGHQLWQGAGPDGLWSLDTRDGSVLWHRDLGHLDATPLLHDDILYVPAQKSETLHETFFYALRAKTGEILWKLDQPGQPWATPILHKSGKIVLTTTGIGQIGLQRDTDRGWAFAISLDGKILWQTALPDMSLPPEIYLPDPDIIIYVTKKGMITALNAADGSKAWEVKASTGFTAPGAVVTNFSETLLAVTADDGVFSLIDTSTGEILFTHAHGQTARTAPLVQDGIIYITTNFGIAALGEQL